jgi:hypothetical protein
VKGHMTTTPNNYVTDLLEAQAEMEAVSKDAKNPFFKSDYTTLNATIEACKQILNKHNYVLLQPIESDQDGVYVCTTLLHTTGEKISSRMKIQQSKANDPQAQGSAITYARRYALKSFLTMSDEDDDGEKAMARTSEPASGLSMPCKIHNVQMTERISPKTGKPYFAHNTANGLCFGKSDEA